MREQATINFKPWLQTAHELKSIRAVALTDLIGLVNAQSEIVIAPDADRTDVPQ